MAADPNAPLERCPVCQATAWVWVQSHVQCARCHWVGLPCCDGAPMDACPWEVSPSA